MGIKGLLPFLEQATKPCHISEFRGATVVIDTYCWLHKGATACALQLAQGEESQVYVNYCLKYIKMLQSYDIRPILVFDGKNLPAKAETEAKRRESRLQAKQRAAELLRLGKTEEARNYLRQSVNITPEMASAVIKECHKINVDCIVAPYESDAQLAFFNVKGIAEIVITEDSDLVLFGCTKVIYKLDIQGCGYLVDAQKIPQAMKIRPDKYNFDKFRYMCILSGCDYINSLPGIGLKKALKFITLTEESNPEIFLKNVPKYLNMRHLEITDEYKENFMMADATFRHQTVFDPFKRKLVPLFDLEISGTNPKYCKNAGEIFDHDKAYQVAIGNLHPTTHKKLNDWSPTKSTSDNSIWSGRYKRTVSRTEQKAQFRKFFDTQPKVETKIKTEDEELIKQEEEEQINKELEFYSRQTTTTTVNAIAETSVEIKKESTSPVLTQNPFIKKLSKFHRTATDSSIIVRSCYFSSESEVQKETTEISQDIEESITVNESPNMDNLPNNVENVLFIRDDDSSFKMKATSGKSRTVGLSQRGPDESSNSKRKKLGPCRPVGLKRSKSESQPTIHNFFDQFRRK